MLNPIYNNVVAQILDSAQMKVVRLVGVVSHDVERVRRTSLPGERGRKRAGLP